MDDTRLTQEEIDQILNAIQWDKEKERKFEQSFQRKIQEKQFVLDTTDTSSIEEVIRAIREPYYYLSPQPERTYILSEDDAKELIFQYINQMKKD